MKKASLLLRSRQTFLSIVLKFDVFPHCCTVFLCCMHASNDTHSVANVPSQQAVKLVVVGPGFVEQCWFGLFLADRWR